MDKEFDDPVPIEINGILDLHHFSPKDLKYLIPEYIDECIDRGIHEVRIIHGKGKGILRRSVHSLLDKNPDVISFQTAPENRGAWGATIVILKPRRAE